MAHRDSVTARKTPNQQFLKLPRQGDSSASIFRTRLTSKEEHPQRIKKQSPPRRSARLCRLTDINEARQRPSQHPLPTPASDIKSSNVSRQRYGVMED